MLILLYRFLGDRSKCHLYFPGYKAKLIDEFQSNSKSWTRTMKNQLFVRLFVGKFHTNEQISEHSVDVHVQL